MTTSGELHPCERVFGTCRQGSTCPYRDEPRECCVAFLKGRCRFGAECKELHLSGRSGRGSFIPPLHPCIRVYGTCTFGENCQYSQLPSESCIKFLKGRCTFGERCAELHGMPAGGVSSMSTLSQFNPMGGMSGSPDQLGAMAMNPMAMYALDPYTQTMPNMGWPPGTDLSAIGQYGVPADANTLAQQMAMYGGYYAMPDVNQQNMYTGAGPTDGRKRGRDGEADGNGGNWKRQQQQGGFDAFGAGGFMGNPSMMYPQATTVSNGTQHPCIRVYGFCRIGTSCRFAKAPIGACLQHLKGSCRFGDNCREPHMSLTNAGDKHPCMRVYGFCRDGENCVFASYPAENCLQFLKGRCRFAEACREPHTNPSTGSSAGPEKPV